MLVITVDGFFMGEELRPAKKLIDEALVKSEEQVGKRMALVATVRNPS